MAMRSAARALRLMGPALLLGLTIPACKSGETPSETPTSTSEGTEGTDAAEAADKAATLAQRRQSLAKEYFESGKEHFDAGRLEEARRDLARVVEMDPSNTEAQA